MKHFWWLMFWVVLLVVSISDIAFRLIDNSWGFLTTVVLYFCIPIQSIWVILLSCDKL